MPERLHGAGQRFHSFHFERAGYGCLGGQAAGVFQLLDEVRALPISPRDQDSACHLRNAFPLDLSGLCHGNHIEDSARGLKKLAREKYLVGSAPSQSRFRRIAEPPCVSIRTGK